MGLASIDSIIFSIRIFDNPQFISFDDFGTVLYEADGLKEISKMDILNAVGPRIPVAGQTGFNLGMIVLFEELLTAEKLQFCHFWMLENQKTSTDSSMADYDMNFLETLGRLAQFSTSWASACGTLELHRGLQSQEIKLKWPTASEYNNEHFEIQKSPANRLAFVGLGKVAGEGTTSDLTFYKFTDEHPRAGLHYYRLKQVDNNGQYEYFEIINVEMPEERKILEIYPNPVKDWIEVPRATGSYSIHDTVGSRSRKEKVIP